MQVVAIVPPMLRWRVVIPMSREEWRWGPAVAVALSMQRLAPVFGSPPAMVACQRVTGAGTLVFVPCPRIFGRRWSAGTVGVAWSLAHGSGSGQRGELAQVERPWLLPWRLWGLQRRPCVASPMRLFHQRGGVAVALHMLESIAAGALATTSAAPPTTAASAAAGLVPCVLLQGTAAGSESLRWQG